MDDLDHSIDIAENDWSSFCDESEECDLLQPSLAYPDDCSLSDAEESGNSTSVAQQQTQRSPDANSNGKESNITEGMHAVSEQPDKSGRVDDVATSLKQVEICARCPGGDAISAEGMDSEAVEETSEGTTKTTTGALQADSINNQSSGEGKELRKDGYLQTKSDQNSSEELDHQELQNVNEPGTTDRMEVKVEKDRWFVTVNENPSRKRGHSSPLKKKRQRKSTNERSHMSNVQEGSMGNDADQEKMKMESNAVKDTESHQSKSLGNKQTNGDLSATLVEAWVDFKSLKETTKECKPALSASALMESCDDFEEFSSHSSDAAHRENFPLQDLCMEKQLHQSSLPLTGDRHDFRSTNHTDQTKGQTHSSDRTSGTPTAVGWDCNESSSADGAFTSAAQETSGSVREGSTCTNNTHSGTQSPPTEDLPASPLEDRLEHSQRLTPTPVSAADSPEMYARAEGNTRPVYAISAFWDDMEKLTINDILHLRMGTSRSPRHNPEAPHGDDLTDTGDTADSDYFTQSEESKPEQSGCEFSTSDFEEEYWQFVGVSRNASPDPDSKTQPSRFVSDDDTNSEGGAVPVPPEELAGQHSDSQEPLTLFMEPKQMRKSKSLFNINDLKGKASPLLSLLDNGSLSLCAVQNLAENTDSVLNSLRRPVCSSLFCMDVPEIHHHMSFSEMLQYFFTETEVNVAYVQLYDPEDISVTPVFKCTCSTFLKHFPQTPVQDYRENPIPIFSSSPPTVRHLTFPKQHYASMSSHCEGLDKVSSIFTAPYSFLQAAGPHGASGAAVMGGSFCWKSLQSLRRISFLDKGSIWCGRSGVLTFPVETENTTVAAPREERAFPASPEVFRGVEEQQKGIQTFWTTKQYGIFSAVKQSDMCLVCIAFASWVLKSSDPDAADAWKAALLANVSALSAIQYLRQYVKKKGPL